MTELNQKLQRALEECVRSPMHHNLLVFYDKCHDFSVRHVSVFDVVSSLICDTQQLHFLVPPAELRWQSLGCKQAVCSPLPALWDRRVDGSPRPLLNRQRKERHHLAPLYLYTLAPLN